MSEIPANLRYTQTHEWAEHQDDGNIRIGITDHAQSLLGDMVFIELPEVGDTVEAGDECAVVESVKAASDVYAPVGGEVIAVNENLVDNPDLVNRDAYDEGWLFIVSPSQPDEFEDLMDAEAYEIKASEDEH